MGYVSLVMLRALLAKMQQHVFLVPRRSFYQTEPVVRVLQIALIAPAHQTVQLVYQPTFCKTVLAERARQIVPHATTQPLAHHV